MLVFLIFYQRTCRCKCLEDESDVGKEKLSSDKILQKGNACRQSLVLYHIAWLFYFTFNDSNRNLEKFRLALNDTSVQGQAINVKARYLPQIWRFKSVWYFVGIVVISLAFWSSASPSPPSGCGTKFKWGSAGNKENDFVERRVSDSFW